MNGRNFTSRCYGTETPEKCVPLAGTEATGRCIVCRKVHDIHNIQYFPPIICNKKNGKWVVTQDAIGG
jgi:hypothetical protein